MKYQKIKQYEFDNNIVSNSGCSVVLNYKNRYNKENKKYLEVVGKYNLYEKIQAHKSDTDIYNIIERYLGGDISVLDSNMIKKGSSFYADISNIPNNVNDYANYMLEMQEKFDVLPVDVKSHFHNNFMEFASSVNGGKVLDDLISNQKLNQKYNFEKIKNEFNQLKPEKGVNNAQEQSSALSEYTES